VHHAAHLAEQIGQRALTAVVVLSPVARFSSTSEKVKKSGHRLFGSGRNTFAKSDFEKKYFEKLVFHMLNVMNE